MSGSTRCREVSAGAAPTLAVRAVGTAPAGLANANTAARTVAATPNLQKPMQHPCIPAGADAVEYVTAEAGGAPFQLSTGLSVRGVRGRSTGIVNRCRSLWRTISPPRS